MKIHYLQHVFFENPGSILEWADKNAHLVTSTKLFENDILPSQDDFDWLFIMGGPMNIYEHDKYPWLIKEKEFIKASIDAGKIVIGICLGGQLIADVIGGKVNKNNVKEIGWFPLDFKEQACKNYLFSSFKQQISVFHWHGDTFNVLPKDNVEVIASSAGCANQAFVYKNRVFGFQFHLECTEKIVRDLIEFCGDELIDDTFIQDKQEILSNINLLETTNKYMDDFLDRLFLIYKNGRII